MELVSVEQLLTKDIRGCVVCFPTDTVYGVVAIVNDLEAIKKIYDLKERDYSKPLAILTASTKLDDYVKNITPKARKLMDECWPGALTIIFEKKNIIPDLVTSNLSTVGFRMPNSKIALQILNHFGIMATTSVNISGSMPLNDLDTIIKLFKDKIDYIVTDKESLSHVSSTVVNCTTDKIKILRQGDVVIN